MRLQWFCLCLVVLGFSAAGCSGKSTHDATEVPAPGTMESDGSGVSAGGQPDTANQAPSAADSLEAYCDRVSCPVDADAVTPACTNCPGGAADNCKMNIFGATRRYVSSCGGVTLVVNFGFDARVWHFDASGKLVGATFSSDTSADQQYGRACTWDETTGVDLCAELNSGG